MCRRWTPLILASVLFLQVGYSNGQLVDGSDISSKIPLPVPSSELIKSAIPQSLVDHLRVLSVKIFKFYSIYQPEIQGVTCLLKYSKLMNSIEIPVTLEDYWNVLIRLSGGTADEDDHSESSRTFIPSIDNDDKRVGELTLWYCAKVYVFSAVVRFFQYIYFL